MAQTALSHQCAALLKGASDSGTPAASLSSLGAGFPAPRGFTQKAAQVVVQRLDVGEEPHGVWLAAHHHHVLHLNEALTVGQVPET